MKRYQFILLIVFMSLLYIFVIPSEPLSIKILFKLIPMWLIIIYGYFQLPPTPSRTHWLILSGLFFCMLGDGLLIWFVIGLTAFLIGHLFYIAAFLKQWSFSLLRLAIGLPLTAYAIIYSNHLINSLNAAGDKALIGPVIAYVTVISLMAWLAFMTGNRWVIIGSLLFLASDSVLAWNMFISTIAFAEVIIMVTYYSAQLCIAHSIGTWASMRQRLSMTGTGKIFS